MRASVSIAVVLALVLAAPAAARERQAPGAPGAAPTWLGSDKHGFGTARTRSSPVWFTLRGSAMSEAYYPDLSTPSLRSLEFVVADRHGGAATRDATSPGRVERVDGLTFRQTVADPDGRWRLTKTYVTDPRRSTVLVHVELASLDRRAHRLYALVDPGLTNDGSDDRAGTRGGALVAWDGTTASALRSRGLRETTSGYVGSASDPWTVLRDGHRLRGYEAATPGNVVQAGRLRVDGVRRRGTDVAIGFAGQPAGASQAAARTLHDGFRAVAPAYARGWRAYRASLKPVPAAAAAVASAYDASVLVLAASEDKAHPGAFVASPTMPWDWGQLTLEQPKSGPYHLVWSRDLYQIATGLLAAGDAAAANRALDFLFAHQQKADGSFPQNTEVDGTPHWTGLQMDEVALPIVLASQLGRADRWPGVERAADFIVGHGPQTDQDRWENQGGYAPGTIAAEIAGLVCAADIARRNGDMASAARYEATADAWQSRVQGWTATSTGPYRPTPYYLRLTKDGKPDAGTTYKVGDGGPSNADQRTIVDPSFLELVRLGVKPADDPAIRASLAVVDQQLAVPTPNGTFWHRYTFDGYGETRAGENWRVTPDDSDLTLGRAWPIFAGERGEYELAAGRPAQARLQAMAASANDGGMIPEQVWDGRPPTGTAGRAAGTPTLSATPLAWSHAQLLRLAWSIEAGRPVERPAVVACRYAGVCG
jgi:glucoamylase